MSRPRLIARLDIKGTNLIKSVQLEGVRVIGEPHSHAVKYYLDGADELILMDAVASLYGRNSLAHVVKGIAKDIFVPITVGGGLRSVEDVAEMMRSGADKVAINTAAVNKPSLISEVSQAFGSQAMVLQVDAKKCGEKKWEVYIDGGREKTGIDVLDWIQKAETLGAGEILLTSIDREGTRRGMDIDLIRTVSNVCKLPLIASGGVGEPVHAVEGFILAGADAVAIADILHFVRADISTVKSDLIAAGVHIREVRV